MASYSDIYKDLEGLREEENLSGSQLFQGDEVDTVKAFARHLESQDVSVPFCWIGDFDGIELRWSNCDLTFDGLGFVLSRHKDFRINFPLPLTDMERDILCDLVKRLS